VLRGTFAVPLVWVLAVAACGGRGAAGPAGPTAEDPAARAEGPSDPPLVALHAVPFVAARGAPFVDEEQAFAAVADLAVRLGFEEARDVDLDLDELVLLPYAGRNVTAWRFYGGGPAAMAHVERISRELYGGRLDWAAGFDSEADADRGLEVFLTVMLAHELGHALASRRQLGAYETDPYLEETRAIRFEAAMLRELVARGMVPPDWPAVYERANRVLLAAAAPGKVASLPKDPAARRARFNAGYYFLATGKVAGHADEVDTVLAIYTLERLEHLARAEPWADVIAALAPPAADPTPAATEAREALPRLAYGSTLTADGLTATDATGERMLVLTPQERGDGVAAQIRIEVRRRLPAPIPTARRAAAALQVLAAARAHDDIACDLDEAFAQVRCRTLVVGLERAGARLGTAAGRLDQAVAALYTSLAAPPTRRPTGGAR